MSNDLKNNFGGINATSKGETDLFAPNGKKSRLGESTITATVWTVAGIVLAACTGSTRILQVKETVTVPAAPAPAPDNMPAPDDDNDRPDPNATVKGGSTQKGPVSGAVIYFDFDGNGLIDPDEMAAQTDEDGQPRFVTGADGFADIPVEYADFDFIAKLDDATDTTAPNEVLEGEFKSLNGVASPLTTLLHDLDVAGDEEKSQEALDEIFGTTKDENDAEVSNVTVDDVTNHENYGYAIAPDALPANSNDEAAAEYAKEATAYTTMSKIEHASIALIVIEKNENDEFGHLQTAAAKTSAVSVVVGLLNDDDPNNHAGDALSVKVVNRLAESKKIFVDGKPTAVAPGDVSIREGESLSVKEYIADYIEANADSDAKEIDALTDLFGFSDPAGNPGARASAFTGVYIKPTAGDSTSITKISFDGVEFAANAANVADYKAAGYNPPVQAGYIYVSYENLDRLVFEATDGADGTVDNKNNYNSNVNESDAPLAIEYIVYDGVDVSDAETMKIEVLATNDAPVFTNLSGDRDANNNNAGSFVIAAEGSSNEHHIVTSVGVVAGVIENLDDKEDDNADLTFSLSGEHANYFDEEVLNDSGVLQLKESANHIAPGEKYNVTITVTDTGTGSYYDATTATANKAVANAALAVTTSVANAIVGSNSDADAAVTAALAARNAAVAAKSAKEAYDEAVKAIDAAKDAVDAAKDAVDAAEAAGISDEDIADFQAEVAAAEAALVTVDETKFVEGEKSFSKDFTITQGGVYVQNGTVRTYTDGDGLIDEESDGSSTAIDLGTIGIEGVVLTGKTLKVVDSDGDPDANFEITSGNKLQYKGGDSGHYENNDDYDGPAPQSHDLTLELSYTATRVLDANFTGHQNIDATQNAADNATDDRRFSHSGGVVSADGGLVDDGDGPYFDLSVTGGTIYFDPKDGSEPTVITFEAANGLRITESSYIVVNVDGSVEVFVGTVYTGNGYSLALVSPNVGNSPFIDPNGGNNTFVTNATLTWAESVTETYDYTVNLINTNDEAPIFVDDALTVALDEDRAAGKIGVTVDASDADAGDTIKYTIKSGDAGIFEVNETTGVISIKSGQNLDFETAESHTLVVTATTTSSLPNPLGGVNNTADATVTVTVNNLNDIAPTEISLSNTALTTSVTTEAPLVATLTTDDTDKTDLNSNANNTYSLVSDSGNAADDNGLFTIVGDELRFKDGATRKENGETYLVKIQVVNEFGGDSFTIDKAFTLVEGSVYILDGTDKRYSDFNTGGTTGTDGLLAEGVNGNALGIDIGTLTVDGATSIALVTATDVAANSNLTLEDNGDFVLDSDDKLSYGGNDSGDFETSEFKTINVKITEDSGDRFETYKIYLSDTNDEVPVFSPATYSATLSEDRVVGEIGVTVNATDADVDSTIAYAITNHNGLAISNNNDSIFEVDSTTGVISIKDGANLDYETSLTHTLTVTATSTPPSGLPNPASGPVDNTETTTVAITVTDVNDNAPSDILLSGTALTVGSIDVGKVTTVDDDVSDNGTSNNTYSLVARVSTDANNADADNALFAIDANTGALTFAGDTSDRKENGENYYVKVQVVNEFGGESHTLSKAFTLIEGSIFLKPSGSTAERFSHYKDADGDGLLPENNNIAVSGVLSLGNFDVKGENSSITGFAPETDDNDNSEFAFIKNTGQIRWAGTDSGNFEDGDSKTLKFIITDDKGTSDTSDDTTRTETYTIFLSDVNDAPELGAVVADADATVGSDLTVTEDSSDTIVTGAILDADDADAGDNIGNLKFYYTAAADQTPAVPTNGSTELTNGGTIAGKYGTFTLIRTDANEPKWTYELDDVAALHAISAGDTKQDQISFIAYDDDGVASSVQTLIINVKGTNDIPVVTGSNSITVDESEVDSDGDVISGQDVQFTAAVFGVTDVDNADSEVTYTIVTGPTNGRLVHGDGGETLVGNAVSKTDVDDGFFSYEHDGVDRDTLTINDSFTYRVTDSDGGTAINLAAPSGEDNTIFTFDITVMPQNDAPVLSPIGVASTSDKTVTEDSSDNSVAGAALEVRDDDLAQDIADIKYYVLTAADNDVPGTPSTGSTSVINNGIAPGKYGFFNFTVDSDAVPTWSYTLASSSNATHWNNIQKLGQGDTGTDKINFIAYDNEDYSNVETIEVTINGVNDIPVAVAAADNAITVAEGATKTLTTSDLDFTDVDNPDSEIIYTITDFSSLNGTLYVDGVIRNTTNRTFTQADVDAGDVTYTHDDNEPDTTTFTYSVADSDGGAAAGGDKTFIITVTNENDAPVLDVIVNTDTGGKSGVTEDGTPAAQTYTFADFDMTDSDDADSVLSLYAVAGVNPNDPNSNDNTAIATTGNPDPINGEYGTFNFVYSADGTVGLSYVLDSTKSNALNNNESVIDKVKVVVYDDEGAASAIREAQVSITGANDAPVLNAITFETGSDANVTESPSGQNTNTGGETAVGAALSITDPDAGDTINNMDFYVTVASSANATPATPTAPTTGSTKLTDNGTVAGTYGTFTFTRDSGGANPKWTYTLDNSKAAFNTLNAGDKFTESISFIAYDGDVVSSVVTQDIIINGTNDAEIVVSGLASSFNEQTVDTTSLARLNVTGAPGSDFSFALSDEVNFAAVPIVGGTPVTNQYDFYALSVADADTLVDADEDTDGVQISVTVTATDDNGVYDSLEQEFTFTVIDLNDIAPVVTSGDAQINLGKVVAAGDTVYTAEGTYDEGALGVDGIVWSLQAASVNSDDAGLFNIDASTGAVSFKAAPGTLVENATYDFTVIATTTGTGATALFDTEAVTLTVAPALTFPAGRVNGTSGLDTTVTDNSSGSAAIVQGGLEVDTLKASANGDVLIGGYDNDIIELGAGADTIVYRFSEAGGLTAVDGTDTIGSDDEFGTATPFTSTSFRRGTDKLVLVNESTNPTIKSLEDFTSSINFVVDIFPDYGVDFSPTEYAVGSIAITLGANSGVKNPGSNETTTGNLINLAFEKGAVADGVPSPYSWDVSNGTILTDNFSLLEDILGGPDSFEIITAAEFAAIDSSVTIL